MHKLFGQRTHSVLRVFSPEARNVDSYLSNQAASHFMRQKTLTLFNFLIWFIFSISSFDMESKYIWEERILLDLTDTMDCKLTVSKAQNVPDSECLQDTFPVIVCRKYQSLGPSPRTHYRWNKGTQTMENYNIIKRGLHKTKDHVEIWIPENEYGYCTEVLW